MEEFISLIHKNLETIDQYVQAVSEPIQYKLLFILLYRLIKEEVDERTVFNILNIFIRHRIALSRIPKISKILRALRKTGLSMIYRFILISIKYERKKKRVIEMLHKYRTLGSESIKRLIAIDPHECHFADCRQYLSELELLIKSFDDRRFLCFAKHFRPEKPTELEYWMVTHKYEVNCRIEQLHRVFGRRLLRELGIELIGASILARSDYDRQLDYLIHCCQHLRAALNTIEGEMIKIHFLRSEIDDLNQKYQIDEPGSPSDTSEESPDETEIRDLDLPDTEDTVLDHQISSILTNYFDQTESETDPMVDTPAPPDEESKPLTEQLVEQVEKLRHSPSSSSPKPVDESTPEADDQKEEVEQSVVELARQIVTDVVDEVVEKIASEEVSTTKIED